MKMLYFFLLQEIMAREVLVNVFSFDSAVLPVHSDLIWLPCCCCPVGRLSLRQKKKVAEASGAHRLECGSCSLARFLAPFT